jgi:hypothetical protein
MPARPTTTDPGLHLVANGRKVRPMYGEGGLFIFVLPRGATEARLISRAGSPAETQPWFNDRRRRGVWVARIVIRGASAIREIPVDHPNLAKGWWPVDRDGTTMGRWTEGDAVVRLPATTGPTMLEIQLGAEMTYVVRGEDEVEPGMETAFGQRTA